MATPVNQFILKLLPSTNYNFSIDWGDGTSEIYNNTTSSNEDLAILSHIYSLPTTYNISITENIEGGFPAIYFNGVTNTSLSSDDVKITEIVSWGNPKWVTMLNSFAGCTNLNYIAEDSLNSTLSGVYSFDNAFYGCSSLEYFPIINTSNANTFNSTWRNCIKLKSFPLLNTQNITAFDSSWVSCSSLSSFPLINTSNATRFAGSGTWNSCFSLSSFPLIDTSRGTIFTSAWSNCISLTSFPLIDLSSALTLNNTWRNCSSLKDFPATNTSNVTSFNATWFNCNSLTSFPFIDTSNGKNFYFAWGNCTNLSASEFPTLNFSNMLTGVNCFNGVKLQTTSYSSLLTSICATNINNNVIFHGGNSTYNTSGSAARVHLVNIKNWTITDGGYETGT